MEISEDNVRRVGWGHNVNWMSDFWALGKQIWLRLLQPSKVCARKGGGIKQGAINPEDVIKDRCLSIVAQKMSNFPRQTLEDGQRSTFWGQGAAEAEALRPRRAFCIQEIMCTVIWLEGNVTDMWELYSRCGQVPGQGGSGQFAVSNIYSKEQKEFTKEPRELQLYREDK